MDPVTVSLGIKDIIIVGLLLALVAIGPVTLMRKASRAPEHVRAKLEGPLDAGLQALADAKWTPAQMDAFLLAAKGKDLTGKAGGLYAGLDPKQQALVEAIAALVRGNPTPPPPA